MDMTEQPRTFRTNGIQTEPNAAALKTIGNAYPRIEKTIDNDVHLLNAEREGLDNIINVLSLAMFHLSRVPDVIDRKLMYSPKSLWTLSICYHLARSAPARRVSCVVIRQLLVNETGNPALNPPPNALDIFLNSQGGVGASSVILRQLLINYTVYQLGGEAPDPTKTLPENYRIDATQLAVEFVTLDAFVEITHPTSQKFSQLSMDEDVIRILGTHFALAKHGDTKEATEDRWTVVNSAAPFINNVINAAENPSRRIAELIVSCDFLTVASQSLVMAAGRKEAHNSAWFRIFKMIIHTTQCKDSSCRIYLPRTPPSSEPNAPSVQTTIAKAFRPIFLPVLDDIDILISKQATSEMIIPEGMKQHLSLANDKEKGKEKEKEKKLRESAALWQTVLTWRALGIGLGFNEEVERGTRKGIEPGVSVDHGKFCGWYKCEEKDSSESYKRCSGCKAVMYCSVDHQKLDWKDGAHKDVCMILQNA